MSVVGACETHCDGGAVLLTSVRHQDRDVVASRPVAVAALELPAKTTLVASNRIFLAY